MPRRRRRERIPTPAWDRERGAIGRRVMGRSPQFYATVGVVALGIMAVAIVGLGFLLDYRADQQRPGSTALQVEDRRYTVEYFTERLNTYVQQAGGPGSAGGQAQTALPALSELLIQETIILRYAPEVGVTATEEEVNAEIANQLNLTGPDDASFETSLQSELARSGLSEDEYRDTIKATVFRTKLTEKFTAELSPSSESISYRQIVVGSQSEADDLRRQIEGGADFAQLAGEKSLDTAAKENGGDAGWSPRGLLDATLEDLLFGLEPNALTVFPASQTTFFVFQLLEKQADRPIDEDKKSLLADNKLQEFLTEKRGLVTIENEMDPTSGNREKVQYALERVYPTS